MDSNPSIDFDSSNSPTQTKDNTDDTLTFGKEIVWDLGLLGSTNNNLRILYITFGIILGLLLLWIIIVIITKEDPVKILSEMTNMAAQIKPVSDDIIFDEQIHNIITPVSDDTIFTHQI